LSKNVETKTELSILLTGYLVSWLLLWDFLCQLCFAVVSNVSCWSSHCRGCRMQDPGSLQLGKSHQTPCFVATVYGWAYSYSYLNFAKISLWPKSRPTPSPFPSLQGHPSHYNRRSSSSSSRSSCRCSCGG